MLPDKNLWNGVGGKKTKGLNTVFVNNFKLVFIRHIYIFISMF
jgi:hypothetical protein